MAQQQAQRNPVGLIQSLADQINTFETAFRPMAGQGDPTRELDAAEELISIDDFNQLKKQVDDLKGTLVRLADQRNKSKSTQSERIDTSLE